MILSRTDRFDGDRFRLAYGLGLVLIGAGCLINLGWLLEFPLLAGTSFGLGAAPSTAILFILSGFSVLLRLRLRNPALSYIAAIFVTCFAAGIFIHRMTGAPMLVEHWFRPSFGPDGAFSPRLRGLMSMPTSATFLALGTGLLCTMFKRSFAVDILSGAVFASGYIALLSFLYGFHNYTGLTMPLYASVLFMAGSVMLLASADNSWLWAILSSNSAGGIVLRRALPLAFFVLPVVGWVRMQSIKSGLLPLELGAAIAVCFAATLFLIVGLLTATALNRLDDEKRAAQDALIRSEKLVTAGRLAATVAHEINNPLAAALNAIFLARTAGSSKEINTFLDVAESELKRVAAVVRQSLGFYRGNSKRQSISLTPLLEEVVRMYSPIALTKSVELQVESDPHLAILADGGEFRQIVTNLVTNAIEASSEGGTVKLSAKFKSNGYAEIRVADEGTGISSLVRDRIFEPFFTTKKDTGTGLGLYVVKELVAKNAGTIAVESSSASGQHGTQFVLLFPTSAELSEAIASSS